MKRRPPHAHPQVSVILPTYNEAENIVLLLSALQKSLRSRSCEYIVVDDDSPDGTAQNVRQFVQVHKDWNIHLVVRKNNHGLTASIAQGVQKARGAIICWMDCDFSHPPEILVKLVDTIWDNKYDIAVASRYVPGGSPKPLYSEKNETLSAVLFSMALNTFTRILFGYRFRDYTSGFVAAKKSVINTLPFVGDYGEYFIHFIVSAYEKHYRIVEIPFRSPPRKFGESKTGLTMGTLVQRGWKYISMVLWCFWHYRILGNI